MNPLVSVVIPAHNEAKWLPGCLESLARQTYPKKEIIVVDDGSRDETAAIAQSFGAKVIRHDTPLGEAKSRNDGLAAASGELVAEIDADAVYPENFLETAVRYFAKDPTIDGLIRGYLLVLPDQQGLIANYWRSRRAASYELKIRGEKEAEYGCQIGKKTAFEALGGYDESLPIGNDVDLGKRMAKAGLKLVWARDLFFWHADPATLRHTLKRVWTQSALGRNFAVRWEMWPSGSRLGIFMLRNIFVSLLPFYILFAFLSEDTGGYWALLAIGAFALEGVAPIVFHRETRTTFSILLRDHKLLVALILPFILFLQLRTSAYAKLYAFWKAPPRYYETGY